MCIVVSTFDPGATRTDCSEPNATRSTAGYLTIVGRAGVWPDSVQVPRWVALQPAAHQLYRCGSLSVCCPSGRRDEAWLQKGLPCSQ